MKLVILHYHLLPGGVTGVIVDSSRAILGLMPEVDEVIIVCGRQENVEAVRGLILADFDDNRIAGRLKIDIVPEIDYADHADNGSSSDIRDILLHRYGSADTIFWVHNFQIGKNPAFTRAVVDIALRQPQQRMLLQIHDFPECARYENLQRLNDEIAGTIYPSVGNVQYVVINTRDRDMLIRSGIPERQVQLLQNPVSSLPAPAATTSPENIRHKLLSKLGEKFPAVIPDAPFLLYPVRTIRRKNVLEAAFIAAASETPVNLLVTLPGVSEPERGYSALVAQSFKEGLVPGLWGIGRDIDAAGMSFYDLVRVSSMIISSSVQEGFGYQFINSLIWGKPLLARYLDILDSILPVFEGHPHELYNNVIVPLRSPSINSLRAYLSMRYQERLREIARFLPQQSVELVSSEIFAMLDSDVMDFSFLPVQVQYALLKDLGKGSYRSEVVALNEELMSALERLLSSRTTSMMDRVEAGFGFGAFTCALRRILGSFQSPSSEPSPLPWTAEALAGTDTTVRGNLTREFLRKEYMRLLYEAVAYRPHPVD